MTCIKIHSIIVSRYREVGIIDNKSRADYFKERRKNTKSFYAEIEAKKMEKLEQKLISKNQTKKEWLDEKIDEDLKK